MSNRTIRLFAMHARTNAELADYREFFEWLAQLHPARTRLAVHPDLVFVIDRVAPEQDALIFDFISGDPQEIPIFYNEETQEVEQDEGSRLLWPARQTRVVIDPASRLLALEIRRAGVSANNLERYFRRLAQDAGYSPDLTLDLSPVQSESFEAELERFTRIREATVVVRRPNVDWDDVEDRITSLADASGGHRAEATIGAAKGESLSKDRGIVEIIRQHARRGLTSIVKARVVGNKNGEAGESVLSTEKHQLKKAVELPRRATADEAKRIVVDASLDLIRQGERPQ